MRSDIQTGIEDQRGDVLVESDTEPDLSDAGHAGVHGFLSMKSV